MEMYQVIRYFLNEMEKKIWHALLTLVLFCLYISIFDVPFTIKNTFIGRLLFPKAFMNAGSANLIFYLISFFGFLWSIFIFAYLLNKTRLKLLNKTFPYLLEILEVCILPLVILFAYIYIYLRVHGEGFSYIRESLLQQELTYSMKWFLCLGSLAPLFFFLSTLNLTKRVRQKKRHGIMKIHVFFSRILFLPQDSFLPKIQKYYCNNFQVRRHLKINVVL
ncbi:hypothetical protein EE55_08795 [Enterococcus faecalis]|nr:hypothetical protein EE55_08795 [Enterococcus faecalis]